MPRGEKVKQFLDNLSNSRSARGSEGEAFWVQDDSGKQYILKKYLNKEVFENKWDFIGKTKKLREEIQYARKNGVKVPTIYDYYVAETGGRNDYFVLQKKMLGEPVYIVRYENLKGENAKNLLEDLNKAIEGQKERKVESIENKLTLEIIKDNLTRQEKLLSEPQGTFDRLFKDMMTLEMKHPRIEIDAYPENLLFNEQNHRFSFIDLSYQDDGPVNPDHTHVLWKLLSFTSLFDHDSIENISKINTNKVLRNEFLIQKRVLDSIEAQDCLFTRSASDKVFLLSALSEICARDILCEFEKRVAVRKI